MSYYKKVLQAGEQVLYNERQHWIVYAGPFLYSLLIFLIAAAIATPQSDGNPEALALCFLFSLCPIFLAWIKRETTEIVVTNKRIIFKRGIVFRKTMEMNMNKVETVDVEQSVLARMLNYGTVVIRGSGSSYEPLRSVDAPLALRNAIIVR